MILILIAVTFLDFLKEPSKDDEQVATSAMDELEALMTRAPKVEV